MASIRIHGRVCSAGLRLGRLAQSRAPSRWLRARRKEFSTADAFRCWWLHWARLTYSDGTNDSLYRRSAAKPFQIDRMLMQLKLGGKLAGVRGIVFGEMMDCRQSLDQDYTLEEVVLRVVGDLGIPVALECGRDTCRAPILRCRLECELGWRLAAP